MRIQTGLPMAPARCAVGGAIRRALEGAGVVFIEENEGGPGVRLRERRKARARAK
jgi:hypothetical protein